MEYENINYQKQSHTFITHYTFGICLKKLKTEIILVSRDRKHCICLLIELIK